MVFTVGFLVCWMGIPEPRLKDSRLTVVFIHWEAVRKTKSTMEQGTGNNDNNSNRILLKSSRTIRGHKEQRVVEFAEISHIVYEDFDCHVCLADAAEMVCPQPLCFFVQKLDKVMFFQVSNTAIVNRMFISKVVTTGRRHHHVVMRKGESLVISSRRWTDFKRWYDI